jgi:hypothetical protein
MRRCRMEVYGRTKREALFICLERLKPLEKGWGEGKKGGASRAVKVRCVRDELSFLG